MVKSRAVPLVKQAIPASPMKIPLIALLLFSPFILPPSLPRLADTAHSDRPSDVRLSVTVVPSSAVIKVGETARINVTVTSALVTPIGQVCFGLEGFPSSGFRTLFLPECATSQLSRVTAILTVEATAAAAPQTVDAFVIARNGGQPAQATLNVTVEPTFPPWIVWAGLLLFLLAFGLTTIGTPKLLVKRIKRTRRRHRIWQGGGSIVVKATCVFPFFGIGLSFSINR